MACRIALAVVLLLPGTAQAIEVHLRDDSLLGPDSAPPLGRVPVLFVHGHAIDFTGGSGSDSATDDPADPNYRKNWWNALGDLPSFKQALDHPGNAGLDIEPYFIRFADQARSITEDAREIGAAVDQIVQRHNSGFAVAAPVAPPPVQVVIVGYSKGTISARQYLKSLTTQVGDAGEPPLPAPRPDYRPVSDFIAISPPNHGLATPIFVATTRTSVQQLYDGVKPANLFGQGCGDPYGNPLANNFIATLNGHPITDTQNAVSDGFASEAPGFRRDGQGPHAGTLYVSLYAAGNADMVGGDGTSGDCRGRGVARNLAANAEGPIAVNVPIAGIDDDGQPTPNLRRLAVHQNTVHAHDVICKALHTAVHHRSPAGQTCTIVDNVPIVPPPARAAVMLVLDMSGSMLPPACPGCGSRLDVLKDSVEIFASLWSMLGRADDRLGATYFRTTVDRFQLSGDPLPVLGAPPPANAGALVADVHAQSTVSGNRTAMGGGLQRAIEALAALPPDAVSRRHVVLFTDGMQNTNPMVREISAAPPRHEIADEPGRVSSGVAPSVPPVRLDALSGITVDTIGVGAGQAFVDLLGDIAAQTGGLARATTDAGDLRQFFVEELVESLRGFSPQLVSYRRGVLGTQGASERFVVEKGASKLLLKVSGPRGRKLDARVFKDGIDVTAVARVADGSFFRIYAFDFPLSQGQADGLWELRVTGRRGTKFEVAGVVDAHRLRYRARLASTDDRVGGMLALRVAVGVDQRPVDGPVKVSAVLERPAIAVDKLLRELPPGVSPRVVREPGMSLAEQRVAYLEGDPRFRKALVPIALRLRLDGDGKGGFRVEVADALVPGIYRATVTIEGEDRVLGRFVRTETATTVVRIPEADRGR